MNFQGVVINATDLNRSVEFYSDVFGFTVLSQRDQITAMSASGSDPLQVIVLREFGSSHISGARHTGLRAFVLEVESTEELQRIAKKLDRRSLLVSQRKGDDWSAVVGRDPDGCAIATACVVTGRNTEDRWKELDDLLYGVGE